MQVKQAMTEWCEFIPPECSLKKAAQTMRELDVGFLPVGNEAQGKLEGTLTDRDIVLQAVAEGKDPTQTQVRDAATQQVRYCFADDDVEKAAQSMREQQIYRLVVLDDPDSKKLCGVISLNDILRHNEGDLALNAAQGIASKAA